MVRTLIEALPHHPLFFEPVPPAVRLSSPRLEERIEAIAKVVTAVPRVDALDVPELVDENHEGRPYYRSGDSREFAAVLGRRTGREIVVNKVVAHLPSTEALVRWTEETVARGIHHAVLVGGSSRYIPYPGPSVTEANRISRPILERAHGLLGNIAIPQRVGEAHRMLQKTRAGTAFFTTQILFDSESILHLVTEYESLCLKAGVTPSAVLISVAPIADEGDAEFVRWLGADIPESAEQIILNGEEAGASARSVQNALGIWQKLAAAVSLSVPLGVNVEQLSPRHLANAAEMLGAFARVLDPVDRAP